ncbi:unnamed protein product [Spirodela intermedia]|uniref:Uncharacterized protein n=1 Tax=Spirodela intermedia TaxID=51605 RepID=A0A7I8LBV1_SPIIN|nr:unnamed protein product [Spirodela intermedia]
MGSRERESDGLATTGSECTAAGDGHAAVLSGRAAAGDRRQWWSPSRLLPLLGSLNSARIRPW